MTTIYGIKNCDTVRKAIKWLKDHDIEHRYHDFRKDGLDETIVQKWVTTAGWENIINKRGLSWRRLSDADKKDIDTDKAIKLILENPTLIKRPVLIYRNEMNIGFDAENYSRIFDTKQ